MGVTLRKRSLKSGRTSLYLDIYESGRRRHESLELYLTGDRRKDRETMRLAEAVRAQRLLELQHGRYGFTAAHKRKACFVAFYREVEKGKKSSNRAWGSARNYLEAFTGGSVSFEAVDERWLEDFQRFLAGSELAPNTQQLYYSKVKATLNEAVRRRIIPANPALRVPNVQGEETERVFLTLDEVRLLSGTECRNDEVKRAFLFSCYTGLRISDVRVLTWAHVRGGRLHLKQVKTGGMEYLPLSPQAKSLLGKRRESDDLVFDVPAAQSSVNAIIRDWVGRAEIEKHVTYHCSRHTFATLALTYGADLYVISKLLGHRELSSTEVYARIVDERKAEAVNCIPALEGAKR